MRRVWPIAVAAVVAVLAASTRAGIYQTVDPVAGPAVTKDAVQPLPARLFRGDVNTLLSIQVEILPNNAPNVLRQKYLDRRDELLRKARTGQATEEELVNLSAALLRLGEADKAVEVLTPRAGRDCRNFMLLANLATANYLADPGSPMKPTGLDDPGRKPRPPDPGRLTRALDILDQAFGVWPKEWPGLTAEQLDFYRRAETTFRDLLRSRRRELAKPPEERTELDPLFGPRDNPVRFVGESGQYEAGQLAAAEREKLPKDAAALVQQLLIWLPHDTRLYWLYGELLNAEGDWKAAREVLTECVDARRYNAKALLEHRQALNSAVEEAAADAAKISWLPEQWQLYLVGGAAALLILALVYFQWRELRRRRHQGAGKG